MKNLNYCDIKCNDINHNNPNIFDYYDQTDLNILNLGICRDINNPLLLDNEKFINVINKISIGLYNNDNKNISCKIDLGINNLTNDNKDKSIYYIIKNDDIENIHISLHISDKYNNTRLHISIKNNNIKYDNSIKYRILYNYFLQKYGIIQYDSNLYYNDYLFYNLNYNYTTYIEKFINILLDVGILYKLNNNSTEITKKQLNINSSDFIIKQLNSNSNSNSNKFTKKQLNTNSDEFTKNTKNGGFYHKYIKYYNKYKDLKNKINN